MTIGILNICKKVNILRMEKTTKWSNVCKKRYMEIITALLKVSKKNVVILNCRVIFNRFAVVDVIFSAKILQTLNCFAVKSLCKYY